jgi:plasmid stabilization system protein ParE
MKQIRFLPEADDEFLAEVEYYSQASNGLGIRFQHAVETALAMASAHPLASPPAHKNTRTIGVKGFPFRLIYRIEPDHLLVVALVHHKRQPHYWVGRIE